MTDDDIRIIRKLAEKHSMRAIARWCGVSEKHIRKILAGKSYKQVVGVAEVAPDIPGRRVVLKYSDYPIIRKLARHFTATDIAILYKVSVSRIEGVIAREGRVATEIPIFPHNLSDLDVRTIRELSAYRSLRDIAKMFGISVIQSAQIVSADR